MCLRLRRGATLPPAKRSVHYGGHPTGGPSLRDGHSQLSHRIKKIGSAREKRMENDFLVNCSTPFLVASRSDATPCNRSVHSRATLQGVHRAGPCGCFAVRATRSPNPTPSARAHPATDIHNTRTESKESGAREKSEWNVAFLVNCSTPFLVASRSDATPCQDLWSRETPGAAMARHCWRREGDSNPRYGFTPYDDLANRCLQPLSHLS